nr:zinc knuckle CX2CX4HX4C [Tanacetum cinerariifolium]
MSNKLRGVGLSKDFMGFDELPLFEDRCTRKEEEDVEGVYGVQCNVPSGVEGSQGDSKDSDFVAKFFDVSLTTFKEINDFTKDLESSKYTVWEVMTREIRKDILDNIATSFARCLIEINGEDDLKDRLTLGVPLIEGLGHTIETINIEYEWKPPRCDLCKIFGHVYDHYPKKVSSPPTVVTSNVVTPTVEKTYDGFQTVGKKKKKGKSKFTNGDQFGGP